VSGIKARFRLSYTGMNRIRLVLSVGLTVLIAQGAAAASLTNQLRQHPSPYLAMHGTDPVAWQEWGPAAIARARRENKLLFVSVGYFTCHWCHVMQRESYKDPVIAAYINRHFIPVKVDRELEAALDTRLIAFAERTQGHGGWPLNAFLTPEGYPLFAVLYQPPKVFLEQIRRVQQLWDSDRESVARLARREARPAKGPGPPALDVRQVASHVGGFVETLLGNADLLQGGLGRTAKFPPSPQLLLVLDLQSRKPNQRLGEFLTLTLDAMSQRGLYDHVGGGFFRYTVDPSWKTPHFEKMLYDNAQLARLYHRAGRLLNRADYRKTARDTIRFLAREMLTPEGAFLAALSAVDRRDIEGGYYLWRVPELKRLLSSEELNVVKQVWALSEPMPFDAGYLPWMAKPVNETATVLRLGTEAVERHLSAAANKLLAARERERKLPRDTKRLAGWNGLLLATLAELAHDDPHDKETRQLAQGIRNYLVNQLWTGERLRRAIVGQREFGAASVEDYAYVAEGLLVWARLTGKPEDYRLAAKVTKAAWQRFYSRKGWRLADRSLMADEPGQDVLVDGPMPSPSGVLIRVSLALAAHQKDSALRRQALAALNSGHPQIGQDPVWHASHIGAMLEAVSR